MAPGAEGTAFGRYEILQPLARGGMAEVLLARVRGAMGFEKLVVIKRILPDLAGDTDHVTMFLDEARLNARLSHSNIVQVLDLGSVGGQYFMAMEYLAGLSLAQIATKAFARGGFPLEIVLGILSQACAGLHSAHEARFEDGRPMNVVHRDVSPHNLVVTFDGTVKVVDFGIAKSAERQSRTRTGVVKGRFAYMAPEQCSGRPVDRRADVFALGVMLHELATGRRLFRRPTPYDTYKAILDDPIPVPSTQRPALPPELDRMVMRSLERDAARRVASASALQDEIDALLRTMGKIVGPPAIARFIEERMADDVEEHRTLMRRLSEGHEVDAAEAARSIYLGADVARQGEEEEAETTAENEVPGGPSGGVPKGVTATVVEVPRRRTAAPVDGSVTPSPSGRAAAPSLPIAASMDSDDAPTVKRTTLPALRGVELVSLADAGGQALGGASDSGAALAPPPAPAAPAAPYPVRSLVLIALAAAASFGLGLFLVWHFLH